VLQRRFVNYLVYCTVVFLELARWPPAWKIHTDPNDEKKSNDDVFDLLEVVKHQCHRCFQSIGIIDVWRPIDVFQTKEKPTRIRWKCNALPFQLTSS